jgi:plastocyanin
MRTFSAILLATAAFTVQAQHEINTTGSNTFNPSEVTLDLGESVTFNVSGSHTATQVSQETWNMNGNTQLPGGFHFTAGTHEYTPDEVGTIYFVCQPHASMGMKGMIIVETGMSIVEMTATTIDLKIYPNPAANEITIEGLENTRELVLVDVQGREVLRRMVGYNERVDISGLRDGNYSALIRDASGTTLATQRLTIAR